MDWNESILYKKNQQNVIIFDVVFKKEIKMFYSFDMRYQNNNDVLLVMRKLRGKIVPVHEENEWD